MHVIVAGDPEQLTGGYLYDARIVDGLRSLGRDVRVHGLAGRFPLADEVARTALGDTLFALDDGSSVILDGLAAHGLPDVLERHRHRLRLIGLVHHPLADETGLDPSTRDTLQRLEARALNAVHQVVVTSAFTADRLTALDMAGPARRVIEPGVAPAPLAVPVDDGICRLLCVASITPRKGHDVLIDALASMEHLPWSCRLIGAVDHDPDWADMIRRRIDASGLSARIDLHGTVDSQTLTAAYRQADLFVLASHYEGYGMVITEALAHGLPIVTTTGGALVHTLPAGCGLAVAAGDQNALADALSHMVVTPDARREAAKAARQAREQLPSWADAAEAFAAVLDDLPAGVSA